MIDQADLIAASLKAEYVTNIMPWGKRWPTWDIASVESELDDKYFYWWATHEENLYVGNFFHAKSLDDISRLHETKYRLFKVIGIHSQQPTLWIFECYAFLEEIKYQNIIRLKNVYLKKIKLHIH